MCANFYVYSATIYTRDVIELGGLSRICKFGDLLPNMEPDDSDDDFELPRAKKPRLEAFSNRTKARLQHSSSTPATTTTAWNYNTTIIHEFQKPLLGLDVDYYPRFFSEADSDAILEQLEAQLQPYYEASRNEVKVFGKVHKIPRKQTAFGDIGLSYTFSGTTVPANSWTPLLSNVKKCVETALACDFNFVLVNRYGDGNDHMGEHHDDETDLVEGAPIASVTFGQARDFVFKHKDSRGKRATKKDVHPVVVCLEHGSLLVMKHPTNSEWYHSLPVRKRVHGVRVNLTFRKMKVKS